VKARGRHVRGGRRNRVGEEDTGLGIRCLVGAANGQQVAIAGVERPVEDAPVIPVSLCAVPTTAKR
jgi:hypothetical protein